MLDWLVLPALFSSAMAAAALAIRLGLPSAIVTGVAVGVVAALAAVTERLRPRDPDHVAFDQPPLTDLLHFVFDYHAGYAVALLAVAGVAALAPRVIPRAPWPASWPTVAQVTLAVLVAEGVSYWQHRLAHRLRWAWPFHALHHRGERLSLIRAARFHGVDIGSAALVGLLPLVLLGAPAAIVTWTAVIGGALGVVQHANVRARTPAWLDWIVCTPVVHRFHHSRALEESDANFGTFVTIFDVLFGTFCPPRADAPRAFGVEGEPLGGGFVAQTLAPFRRQRSSSKTTRSRGQAGENA